jgi:hypothetical protein
MNAIILAAFPGLLFSVQPPARQPLPKNTFYNIVKVLPSAIPADSCDTYIYKQSNNIILYYNGKPVSQEMIDKLGPMAAPFKNSLNLENIG